MIIKSYKLNYISATRKSVDLESHWSKKERPVVVYSDDKNKYEENFMKLLDENPFPENYLKDVDDVIVSNVVKKL